jgi:hypothetical protein
VYGLDLYTKQHGMDDFRSLLLRPLFDRTCAEILSSCNIPTKIRGYDRSKLINTFLDSSSINNVNSRIVILLSIYSKLKQIFSSLDVVVHRELLNDVSLHFLNGDPKIIGLSSIIGNEDDEIIHYHVENNLLTDYS